jgi:hypothetical protein
MVQVEFEVSSDVQWDIDDEEIGRAAWEGYIEAEVVQMIDDIDPGTPMYLEARIERIEDALNAFINVLRPSAMLPDVPKPQRKQVDDDMVESYRARVAAITATEGAKEKAYE